MSKGKNMHFNFNSNFDSKFNSNNFLVTLDLMLDCLTPRNPCQNYSNSPNTQSQKSTKGSKDFAKGFSKYKKALASDCKRIESDFAKALSKDLKIK